MSLSQREIEELMNGEELPPPTTILYIVKKENCDDCIPLSYNLCFSLIPQPYIMLEQEVSAKLIVATLTKSHPEWIIDARFIRIEPNGSLSHIIDDAWIEELKPKKIM